MAQTQKVNFARNLKPIRGGAVIFSLFFWLGSALVSYAQHGPAHGAPARVSKYEPYKFLIGEWDVAPEGGTALGIERFRWGGNQSYLWFSFAMLNGGKEEPHFEGMLMWNGVRKNLDMLLAVDLQYGLAQETGSVYVQHDGTVVRDILATYSEGVRPIGQEVAGPQGATARFRQTFKSLGPDKILTTVMRESKEGWVATFPGSERLIMTRRSKH